MKIRRLFFILLSVVCQLAAAQNYRTIPAEKIYLATDRYYFSPGETVDYSLFIGGDFDRDIYSRKIKVTLENARGQVIDSAILATLDLNLGGSFVLPNAGGLYFLKVIGIHQLNYLNAKPLVKELFVQEYITKNFFIKIELDKNNYNPNSKVDASITYTGSGNKVFQDMEIEVHLVSNGDVIETKTVKTDIDGKISVSFTLPSFDKTESTNLYITTSCLYRGTTFTESKKIYTDKQEVLAQVFYEHGNTGFLPNRANKVIVKSTDKYGNDLDIEGYVTDENGINLTTYESFAQGLGSFTFNPVANKTYFFISDDVKISLEQSEEDIALTSLETSRTISLGVKPNGIKAFRWIVSNKSRILLDEINRTSNFSIDINEAQVIISTVLINDKIVAQRAYIAGWDKINYAVIETPGDVMTSTQFNELTISNSTGKGANHSIAIVEENNIKQMEDKSHNALTWLLLGSEFSRTIERPQFYFDKNNAKAKDAILLLMNTLHSTNIRDVYTGKAKAHADKAYLNNYVIGGVIRENNYNNSNLLLKNASVNIKNSNIGTTTDENGRFTLEIPASFSGAIELVVKKGVEKQFYNLDKLGKYKNFSEGFYSPQSIVSNSDMTFESIALDGYKPLELNQMKSEQVTVDGFAIIGSKNSFLGARSNATYTTQDISMLPTRSINSISSVMVTRSSIYQWNWSSISPIYPADIYFTPYQNPFLITLEYAQVHQKITPTVRNQKGSTLYWVPSSYLKAGEKSKIVNSFNAKAGGYRILVEGMDETGRYFYGEKYIEIKEKLEVITNIPKRLFLGDIPKIPVTITNNLNEKTRVNVSITGLESQQESIDLEPFETIVRYYALDRIVDKSNFKAYVSVTSTDYEFYKSEYVDVGVYKIQEMENIGGNNSSSKKVNLANAEYQSLSAKLKVFPTFDKQLIQISENMLRQPGGCFEQVSSSNYPNIMVLFLLKNTNSNNGTAINRATEYLKSGYNQLAKYETPAGGFEWYGRNPPHQSLTAYGLLQFHLIKEIGFNVDLKMFNRNLEWLWNQRDKQGGFKFHEGKYGFSSSNYSVNNAYITWVLSRVCNYDLREQISAIEKDVNQRFDAYKMALLVNMLFNTNRNSEAEKYLVVLKSHLDSKSYTGLKAEKSVVNAYGNALDAEVIALTLLATLNTQDEVFKQSLKSALLSTMNSRGYFGSTQATALSLEALTRLGIKDQTVLNHNYKVKLNGIIIDEMDYEAQTQYDFDILNLDQVLGGINTFEVITNGLSVPYVLELKWTETRTNALHPDLGFSVKYKKDSLEVGENNLLSIRVANTSERAKGQVVATINIPETYQVSTEELRDLSRKQVFDYYELKDNVLNLYFLEMGPAEVKQVALNLTAIYPGSYHSATHEVFEYYNPEIVSKIVSPITIITNQYK